MNTKDKLIIVTGIIAWCAIILWLARAGSSTYYIKKTEFQEERQSRLLAENKILKSLLESTSYSRQVEGKLAEEVKLLDYQINVITERIIESGVK